MRCRRAQQWMTVADALAPRRCRALDRHVADCAPCRAAQALGTTLELALAALPHDAPVSAALEQATFRAVRLAAAAEDEGPARSLGWWIGVMVPGLAAAAAVVLAVGLYRGTTPAGRPEKVRAPGTLAQEERPGLTKGTLRRADAAPEPAALAVREGARRPSLDEPPPELAAAPERFIDLPVLRNLDKLRHYETITGVDDQLTDPGQVPRSDG